MILVAQASSQVSTNNIPVNEPNKCFYLSTESVFTAVLGKYRKVSGMSEFELRDITDYFQIRDGRVSYRQFCKVVCEESKSLKQRMI